jgi:hypothetical protein
MQSTSSCLIGCLFLVSAGVEADEVAPAVAIEILQANRDYQASMTRAFVQFRQRWFKGTGDRAIPDCQFTWAKSGRREVFLNDPDFDFESGKWGRVWCSWNDSQGLELNYFSFDTSRVSTATHTQEMPDLLRGYSAPTLALGWKLRGWSLHTFDGENLVGLMEKANTNSLTRESLRILVGDNEFAEFACVRWPLLRFTPKDSVEHELVAHFDEGRAWLPRMWHIKPLVFDPQTAQLYGVAIKEFTTTRDSLLGHDRFFPRVIIEYGGINMLTEVETVQVNENLSDALFSPEITDGAKIIHFPGTRRQLVTYGGEDGEKLFDDFNQRELQFKHPEHAARATASETQPVADAVDATPVHSEFVSKFALAIACVLFVVVAVSRFRRA